MITDAVLNFFGVLVDAGLLLLPVWVFPSVPWGGIVAELTRWNSLLPIYELWSVASAYGGLTLAMLAYYVVMWVIKRLTFSG